MAFSRPIHLGWEDLRALGAATAPPERAARDWRALMAAIAFDEIGENTQRVMPAIFRNLRDQPDLPERDRMRGAFKYAWSRNTEMLHGVRAVLAAFSERSIDHRILKGTAVQVACDSLGSRAMGDVDLLVRADDVERACSILRAQDFRRSGHSECAGHADADHHGALTFNKGTCHVDLHVAEYKPPVRLLMLMMAAPARIGRAAGVPVRVPPAELLLLHAAVHGCLASGPTDFVQAVVDVSMLSQRVDRGRLLRAARRTGTVPQLMELDAAVRAAGGEPLGIDLPAADRVAARIGAGMARMSDFAAEGSSVMGRIRGRRRGERALADVAREFQGRRYAYTAWLRLGQFAVAERAIGRGSGGFLPRPRGVWTSGTTDQPFTGGSIPGLTASAVADAALDWRFRVELPGPQPRVRLTLDSSSFDRLDAFVFCNGAPVTQLVAGDPGTRVIHLRDLGASNEFSVRPLWRVCTQCYRGLNDLRVRIDLGDDAT